MPASLDDSSKFAAYARPDKLVSTEWLSAHLDDPAVVVVESDEDVLLYETGHIRAPSRSTGTPISTIRSCATT